MKRRLRVTISRVRRQTTVLPAAPPRTRCLSCGREVEALTRGQAAEILETGERELDEFIAAGHVHAIPTAGAGLRVCKDSLFSRAAAPEAP